MSEGTLLFTSSRLLRTQTKAHDALQPVLACVTGVPFNTLAVRENVRDDEEGVSLGVAAAAVLPSRQSGRDSLCGRASGALD